MKVLVVDDDPVCLKAIENTLVEQYQCEVETANSAEVALDKIYNMSLDWDTRWYDLVLLDVQMPVIKGDTLAKIIKETEKRLRDCPIIAITGHATKKEKAEFLKLGLTDLVFKPITAEKLEVMLSLAVKREGR